MSRRLLGSGWLRLGVGLLVVLHVNGLFATQGPPDAQEALLGYDPVILVEESREVLGDESISLVRGGFWYLFASQSNKKKFEGSPERYEIQNGGVCARMGGTVSGHPDNFLVHDGRIYIFGSENCRNLFKAHPEKYLETDRTAFPASPESRRRGMELMEKVVQFLGGAAKIDSLRTLHQTASGQRGGERARVDLWRRFPDQWKVVVHHSRFGDFGALLTDGQAYGLGGGRSRALAPGPGQGVRAEMLRDPLEIARSRKRPDFEVTLLDGDASRVRTRVDGVETVLNIDGETGEVREISYLGRGDQGEVGTVVKRFSDYRQIDGLRRPFRIEATFEGASLDEESLAVESIDVDSELDAALFSASDNQGGH